MTQRYSYLDSCNFKIPKQEGQALVYSQDKTDKNIDTCPLKLYKKRRNKALKNFIEVEPNIEGLGRSSRFSDKNKEQLYNQFVNHCLIQTTDDFIKKKYKIFMKKKKTKQKS